MTPHESLDDHPRKINRSMTRREASRTLFVEFVKRPLLLPIKKGSSRLVKWLNILVFILHIFRPLCESALLRVFLSLSCREPRAQVTTVRPRKIK